GFADWRRWTLGQRALEAAEEGRYDEAEELAAAAFAASEAPWVPQTAVYARLARATVLRARGEHERVVSLAREAYADHVRTGFTPSRSDWKWYEGDSLRALGRLDDASEVLNAAAAEAGALGAQRVLWRIWESRALIADARARPEEARDARAHVRAIVEGIARSLEPVALADTFRARADVAAALAET
ncbi:MAG: hypothetical protein M3470_10050, partial [Chloroflexota bacterium]|nr:hypothetical protein [Chloroflexota bacterium]